MKISTLPIYIIAGFNFFTLAMYLISPYLFNGQGFFASVLFVFVSIVAMIFGYFRGEYSGKRAVSRLTQFKSLPLRTIFLCLSVFYALTFLIKYAYLLKFQIFDVDGMIRHLLVGVENPKLGYLLSIDETRQATVSWSLYFFISIFNSLYFVLGFVLWGSLSRLQRVVFLLFLVLELFYWVGRGTNFGVVSLIFIFLFANVIKSKGKFNVSHLVKYILLLVMGLISFSMVMYSRSGGAVDDFQVFALPLCDVDETSLLFDMMPERLHTSMLTVFSYLVQGYYNTAVAFELDFRFSWFGGWNPSIQSLYSAFGFDFADNTYIQRLDVFGIDPRVNWHSSYTWFANDVSFYGVPLVMYILGYIIGYSWVKAVVVESDIFSKLIFILLSVSALLNFANNNFIAYYFYSFIFILPYWVYKNKFLR